MRLVTLCLFLVGTALGEVCDSQDMSAECALDDAISMLQLQRGAATAGLASATDQAFGARHTEEVPKLAARQASACAQGCRVAYREPRRPAEGHEMAHDEAALYAAAGGSTSHQRSARQKTPHPEDNDHDHNPLEDPMSLLQLQRSVAIGGSVSEGDQMPGSQRTKDLLKLAAGQTSSCAQGCGDAYRERPRPAAGHQTVHEQASLYSASVGGSTERQRRRKATNGDKKGRGYEENWAWKSWMKKYGDVMNMNATYMKEKSLPPRSRHVNAKTIEADWLHEYAVEDVPLPAPKALPPKPPSNLLTPVSVAIIALVISTAIITVLNQAA